MQSLQPLAWTRGRRPTGIAAGVQRAPDVPGSPVKWRPPALARHTTASGVLGKTLYSLARQLRANQPGAVRGRNPEYLHQLRVAVRRMRALLSLYSNLLRKRELERIVRDLRWLARALGPARDADVFVGDIWPKLRGTMGDASLIAELEAVWRALQRRAGRKARRALESQRYHRMVRRLEQWTGAQSWRKQTTSRRLQAWEGNARDFARVELERGARRIGRRAGAQGRKLDRMDANELHRFRVRIKKLRYVMDMLGPLFKPRHVGKVLTALSRLQDVLGELNDLAVAEQKLTLELAKRDNFDAGQLRAQIAQWRALRSQVLKRRLQKAWRTYRRVEAFW